MRDKVYYFAYGSNVLRERFLSYLTGVPFEDSTMAHSVPEGDVDTTTIVDRPISVKAHAYFALEAPHWHGSGALFLDFDSQVRSTVLGRGYLLTVDQFLSVVRQENFLPPDTSVPGATLDISPGESAYITSTPYGRLVALPHVDGYPMFTFTAPWEFDEIQPTSSPDSSADHLYEVANVRFTPHFNSVFVEYARTVARGLMETYPAMTHDEIIRYLHSITSAAGGRTFDEFYTELQNETGLKH